MKKVLVYVGILGVIGLLVVAGLKAVKHKKDEEAKTPLAYKYDMRVETMNPKISDVVLTLPYLATTKSNDDVKISSRVSARIKYIVKSGTRIKKGTVIVKIDDKDLKTQLESLNLNIDSIKSQLESKQVALSNLQKSHKRTEELLTVRGASKEQFDKEVTNLEATKSAIDTLQFKIQELTANKSSVDNKLSYTMIKSPVDGIVTRLANVGDIAMMGKPLISISAKSNSYLVVRLPADIKADEIIFEKKIYMLNGLNTTFNGLLEYLANIDSSLASDQMVNIDVVIYNNKGYNLPHDAILNRDGKSYVLVIKDHKAIAKSVKIVANAQEGVVVDGVEPSENIVVAKQDILLKLLTGIKVKTIKYGDNK